MKLYQLKMTAAHLAAIDTGNPKRWIFQFQYTKASVYNGFTLLVWGQKNGKYETAPALLEITGAADTVPDIDDGTNLGNQSIERGEDMDKIKNVIQEHGEVILNPVIANTYVVYEFAGTAFIVASTNPSPPAQAFKANAPAPLTP